MINLLPDSPKVAFHVACAVAGGMFLAAGACAYGLYVRSTELKRTRILLRRAETRLSTSSASAKKRVERPPEVDVEELKKKDGVIRSLNDLVAKLKKALATSGAVPEELCDIKITGTVRYRNGAAVLVGEQVVSLGGSIEGTGLRLISVGQECARFTNGNGIREVPFSNGE